MDSLEDRLARVEREVDVLSPSIRERLDRLERAVDAKTQLTGPPSRLTRMARVSASVKRFVAWLGPELPKFLFGAVLLVLGFAIKDSVDLAIKQRQLDLSYAKEMQALLQKMSDPSAEMAQLASTAIVLAAYGEAALPPLLNELRFTGLRANAAEMGLRSLALTHPRAGCEILPRVLENRSQQYDWQGHQKVVRLLGENDCRNAIAQLRQYREIIVAAAGGNAARFTEIVREPPAAPGDDYPRLLAAVDRSLGMLQR